MEAPASLQVRRIAREAPALPPAMPRSKARWADSARCDQGSAAWEAGCAWPDTAMLLTQHNATGSRLHDILGAHGQTLPCCHGEGARRCRKRACAAAVLGEVTWELRAARRCWQRSIHSRGRHLIVTGPQRPLDCR